MDEWKKHTSHFDDKQCRNLTIMMRILYWRRTFFPAEAYFFWYTMRACLCILALFPLIPSLPRHPVSFCVIFGGGLALALCVEFLIHLGRGAS